ncbi:MAG: hypothetical protein MSIBF_01260 [Candidatus Altiarchaeales archaeon IMC4]|nr:MAG: hypothetical protein MSIBF_01260 [Candidatus Altiarchaeales archaeon IMC4]
MSSKRAQSGLELIISVGFVILLFIVILLFGIDKTRWSNDFRTLLDAKMVCNSVVDNVNMISLAGSGYYRHFSIPAAIHGGNDYNITIDGRRVEISWDTGRWSAQAVTSNITVFCLDYGLENRNTVFNRDGVILVGCNRPDLFVAGETLTPKIAGLNTTVSAKVDVLNFGPHDAGAFNVTLNNESVNVAGLAADTLVTVSANLNLTVACNYSVNILVDSGYNVTESIESDNVYNGSIVVG